MLMKSSFMCVSIVRRLAVGRRECVEPMFFSHCDVGSVMLMVRRLLYGVDQIFSGYGVMVPRLGCL